MLQEQGRAAEAEPLAREALATSTELLGSKHPDTLGFGADLARCLVELGRLPEAEEAAREVEAGRRTMHGDEHRETRQASRQLANVLVQQEKHGDA